MNLTDTYKLSEYLDLGHLDERQRIRLVRNRLDGRICTARTVPADMLPVYERLSQLHSPHIPAVYEIFPDEKEIVVITEYIDGRTIAELLEERPFSESEACRIAGSLCEALQLLHGLDPPLICRDLKAENIMIDTAGRVMIVDFDIARLYREGLTRDTKLLGTQEYAAPEQFGYGQTDARTDIYALGILLNYMVLRKFPAEERASGRIGEIVEKCTRLDPDQRYQTAAALAEALGKTDAAGYLPPGFRTRTWRRMLIAVCGYALITWFCFSLEITDETGEILRPAPLLLNRVIFWLSQILWIFLAFDYRGIRTHLPLVGNSRRWVRLTGCVIAWFVLLFLAAAVASVLEALLF